MKGEPYALIKILTLVVDSSFLSEVGKILLYVQYVSKQLKYMCQRSTVIVVVHFDCKFWVDSYIYTTLSLLFMIKAMV
jgi:hypothetical protein